MREQSQVEHGINTWAQASAKSKSRMKEKVNHSTGKDGMKCQRMQPAHPYWCPPLCSSSGPLSHDPRILDTQRKEFCPPSSFLPPFPSSSLCWSETQIVCFLFLFFLSFLFALPILLTKPKTQLCKSGALLRCRGCVWGGGWIGTLVPLEQNGNSCPYCTLIMSWIVF